MALCQDTYGLLGRKLGHSFSPQIHRRLGSWPYALYEREPEAVEEFIRQEPWDGVNVTIPYKRDAARLADEQSPRVQALGVANTLVRRPDGSIFAENTDVLGFSWMLGRFCMERLGQEACDVLRGRKAVVLGSGGASQAVRLALEEAGARVVVISRTGSETYETLAERHSDAVLMVNTTPVGMYPNCPATPVGEEALARMDGLRGVLDVVYNPCRTGICLAAERLGLPFESGLAMLVAQAFYASELFQGHALDEALVPQLVSKVAKSTANVVLIGMPGSGKSSSGKRLARILGRPFVDLDDAIQMETGLSPAQIIREQGEDAFRKVETGICATYGARSGLVIACGGGVVTRAENYPLLHQNGTIVLLDRDVRLLSSAGRPLSQTRGVEALAAERMPLYRAWADVTVSCTGSAFGDADMIRALLEV